MKQAPAALRTRLTPASVLVGGTGIFLLMLLLGLGAPVTHSVGFNLPWAVQFSDLLRAGVLYPRWLPDAFGGLGSPSFIFYAPLPFFLIAVADIATAGVLDPARLVGFGCALMLLASGASMWCWLRRRAGRHAALLGAAAYMLAPYHLFDVFVRGSLGELAAYAILPLLAAALEDALRGERGSAPRFALCTAALLLSHLPSALVIGGLLVPARIAWFVVQGRHHPRSIRKPLLGVILGGTLGLGAAAVYVVPALGLLDMARMDYFSGGHYDARRWLLLMPSRWGGRLEYAFVLSVTLALVFLATVGLLTVRPEDRRSDVAFWPLVILLVGLLMSGLVPWIWEPWSPFARIEFPWRMLLIAEFAAICVAVDGYKRWTSPQARLAIGVPALLALPAFGIMITIAAINYRVTLSSPGWRAVESEMLRLLPDAIEYLPHGHSLGFDGRNSPTWSEVFALSNTARDRGAAWLEPPQGSIGVAPQGLHGEAVLTIDTSEQARVVLRRFAYPLWRLETAHGTPGPVLEPHGADRFLSFIVPPGRTQLHLSWSPPRELRVGEVVSAVSLLIIAGLVVYGMASRRRRDQCFPASEP